MEHPSARRQSRPRTNIESSWNFIPRSLRERLICLADSQLIHWPVRLVPNESSQLLPVNPDGTRAVDRNWDQRKTWAQMEEIYRAGTVKAIGVSNWSIPYLEHLKETWTVVPAVNQVELHPYNPQHGLKAWCEKEGILLESYCPLGSTSGSHRDVC